MPAIAPSAVSSKQSTPAACSAVGTVAEVVGDSVVVVVAGDSVVVVGAADVVGAALVPVNSASASAVGGASAASSSEPPHAEDKRARAVIATTSRMIRFIGILPSDGVVTVQINDNDAVDSFSENQPCGWPDLGETLDQPTPKRRESPPKQGFSGVGLRGFEPPTFGPPDRRANQAAPQPV